MWKIFHPEFDTVFTLFFFCSQMMPCSLNLQHNLDSWSFVKPQTILNLCIAPGFFSPSYSRQQRCAVVSVILMGSSVGLSDPLPHGRLTRLHTHSQLSNSICSDQRPVHPSRPGPNMFNLVGQFRRLLEANRAHQSCTPLIIPQHTIHIEHRSTTHLQRQITCELWKICMWQKSWCKTKKDMRNSSNQTYLFSVTQNSQM